MANYLYPTIEQTLICPKRFKLEKVMRKEVIAPFLSTELGKQVHTRIASSLRSGKPASTKAFYLPRRLIYNQGDCPETLMLRAYTCLENFNQHCYPWLETLEVIGIEEKFKCQLDGFAEVVTISGVVDAVIKTSGDILLLDWKTGSMANASEQLKWYSALYHMKSPEHQLEARAINLFDGETIEVKDFENPQAWLYTKVKAFLELTLLARDNPDKMVAGSQCSYCPYAQGCEASQARSRFVLDTLDGEVIPLA
jgi:CRISPR/Cas system-associated exonuclease Cas4 (RecB family)